MNPEIGGWQIGEVADGRRWPSRITLPPMRSIHSATTRSGAASCAQAGARVSATQIAAILTGILAECYYPLGGSVNPGSGRCILIRI